MGQPKYRRRLCVLFVLMSTAAFPVTVFAQNNRTAAEELFAEDALDPDQPLSEIPDFGVEWPDLDDTVNETVLDDQAEDAQANTNTSSDSMADQSAADALFAGEGSTSLASDGTDTAVASDLFQPVDASAQSKYQVRFAGLPEKSAAALRTRFDTLSALAEYRGQDSNFAQVRRRADSDKDLVERLLQIEGFYDAVVRMRFVAEGNTPDPNDLEIVYNIAAGPQYKLAEIALDGLEQAQDDDPARLRTEFGLKSGDVINSDEIVSAAVRLDEMLAETGYAFAKAGEPELVIDHAARDGDLSLIVTPGGRYEFGKITMADTQLFGPDHAQLIARFDPGDVYKASDVEDLRRALIATSLVSTVTLIPVRSDEPGKVDLAVNITPAPLRTIAGELGYGTGEGIRSQISWEHRNLFPPEGMLRVAAVLATQEQSGSVTFRRNNYRRRDNVLNGRFAVSNIDRPAYDARTLLIGANLERQSNLIYQKRWSWSAGIELIASQERDIVGGPLRARRETYFIGALPASIIYDASDDLLNPTRGFRLGARVAPEASLQSGSFFYVRNQFDGSAYYPVNDKVVIAGRARFANITGASRNRIAPSRRLYSGGGGSVRGFGYQQIGPRDLNNDPIGGRSLVEFSLEARIRLNAFGGNFGVVPFIDGGNVYSASVPDFTNLRFGAGLGVRYYSDFGPIRVDVATPINPQPGDSRIAVYVSLGQAF